MHRKKNDKIVVAGTGCALVDYIHHGVRFDSPGFQKYNSVKSGDGGLSIGKLIFKEEIESFSATPYPEILIEICGNRPADSINPGGPGLVSLINASQLLPEQDFKVLFYGGTGKDRTADLLIELLRNFPLNISNLKKISSKLSPFTDVLSDPWYANNQGERTFINNIGAAWDYNPDMLGEEFYKADIVCFGGTALVPQIHDSLNALLEKAKINRCLTVVNTVFDFRNEKKNPQIPWPFCESNKNYQLIDLLIMNEEEAMRISGTQTLDQAATFFILKKVNSFIITNGGNDLYSYSNGNLFMEKGLRLFPVSNKVRQDLSNDTGLKGDTTGCGDNFAGGAIASLASQFKKCPKGRFSMDELISWAVASGGFACFYLGGTYFEKNTGEKLSKVKVYKSEYLKQISSL